MTPNAVRQKRHRDKRADKLARYEAALRVIAIGAASAPDIARTALGDGK